MLRYAAEKVFSSVPAHAYQFGPGVESGHFWLAYDVILFRGTQVAVLVPWFAWLGVLQDLPCNLMFDVLMFQCPDVLA